MKSLPAFDEIVIPGETRCVTFWVGKDRYGVDIACVESIIAPLPVTPVPRTPPYFIGIANLRGDIITVIDLRERFGVHQTTSVPERRLVIVAGAGGKIGLWVDQIGPIENVVETDISRYPAGPDADPPRYLYGTLPLADGGVLVLLDHDELIDNTDFTTVTVEPIVDIVDEGDCQSPVSEAGLSLLVFCLETESYAIESRWVDEIIEWPALVNVLSTGSLTEGVFYWHNKAVLLVDFREKLGFERRFASQEPLVVVLKSTLFGENLGLVVDGIFDMISIDQSSLLPPPLNLNRRQHGQLLGVFHLGKAPEDRIVMFLNLQKLFERHRPPVLPAGFPAESTADSGVTLSTQQARILEFTINGEIFAVRLADSIEVVTVPELVPVPKASPFIGGIANHRGAVISIVDLPKMITGNRSPLSSHSRLILANAQGEKVGLLVEAMIGIRYLPPFRLSVPVDLMRQRGAAVIEGVYEHQTSGEIGVLIATNETLAHAQGPDVELSRANIPVFEQVHSELEWLEKADRRQLQRRLGTDPIDDDPDPNSQSDDNLNDGVG
jgi:purine-binding chemotaxis protein CheW